VLASPDLHHKIQLFMDYADHPLKEVPDPYYGGEDGFQQVLDLVELAAKGLLNHMQKQLPK